jgi:hypothetical protein
VRIALICSRMSEKPALNNAKSFAIRSSQCISCCKET